MVEHATVNRVVEGSSPSSGANFNRKPAGRFTSNLPLCPDFSELNLFLLLLRMEGDLSFQLLAWPVLTLRRMHKTYFYIIAFMLPLAAIVAAIITKLKVQVPVGYQDESGFHIGSSRAESKVNWPPFW